MNSIKSSFWTLRFSTRAGTLALLAVLGAGAAQAQFFTGFEEASGYTTNGTAIGVHDNDVPTGNTWSQLFGSSSNVTSSTANPLTGEMSLQMVSPGSAAQNAYLNLGSSAPTSSAFNVHFGLAVGADISTGTGNQVQIYFGGNNGAADLFYSSVPFWFALMYDNGNLTLSTMNSATNAITMINIGAYTTFSNLGDYITFDITIDPTTDKFTSVILSGELGSADVTSIVAASYSGTIPSKGGVPDNNISVVIGSNDSGTVYLDDLSITQVPEPSTWALLSVLGLSALIVRKKYCA